MRKSLTLASLATAGLIALAAPASAQPETALTASTECGTVTVTLVNGGPRLLGVDFGFGDPTRELLDPALVIAEGPFAGEPFGLFYDAPNGALFTVPAGETSSSTLDIPEDEGGGTVTVVYRARFGPEQNDHLVGGSIQVDTDCVAEVVPEPEPEVTPLPEVLPEVVPERPLPAVEPVVEVASQTETLAFTGSTTLPLALTGAGAIAFGAAAVAVTRRRAVK